MQTHKDGAQTDLGMVKIHKNVIASITSLAATEVEGVKRIGSDLKSGLMELLGKKTCSSIKVDIDKQNEEVTIEIPLIVRFDYNIPEVAHQVQENVRQALEKMTHLLIKDIHINVQGVEMDAPAAKEDS